MKKTHNERGETRKGSAESETQFNFGRPMSVHICTYVHTYINIVLTTTVNANSWSKVGRAGEQISAFL